MIKKRIVSAKENESRSFLNDQNQYSIHTNSEAYKNKEVLLNIRKK